ncbi:hypothetical protein KY285_007592 [Solanum tuberosum]|nr:hypothetical protein KY285_007592 [Solanum tuberosum]
MIQGHNKEQCYVVHQELHPYKEKSQQEERKKTDDQPCNENNKGKGIDRENENRKGDGFVEPRRKNWGGGRNKEPQKVWNGVGVKMDNKYNLLDTGEQDQSINQEKEQSKTHKVDGSNNSKGVKEAGRATSSERTISEVRNKEKHADPKNLQKGVNEEELMQKSTTTRSSYTKRREGEVTSRNLFASNYEEERDNVVEEGGIPKGPNLIEEDEGEMQNKKETEKDADIEFNIQQINKADDLSPRHTDNLKNGARKGRPIIPLQVKTRSSRDRGHNV